MDKFDYEGNTFLIKYKKTDLEDKMERTRYVIITDDVKNLIIDGKIYVHMQFYDFAGVKMFGRMFPDLDDKYSDKIRNYLKGGVE